MSASVARRLLVATPTLIDPNFARSVVFVIEHNDEGAIGIVLNRPTDAALEDAVPEWAPFAAPPAVAFVGGPVQQEEAVIGLAHARHLATPDGFVPLIGGMGTIDLGHAPYEVAEHVSSVRVFAGYSGWGPGQLDDELEQDGWYVVDAVVEDLVTGNPAGLWRAVLRRQGGDLAVAANYPEDLRSN